MRRVIAWVQEGLFRLLGMLSAASYFIHQFRIGISMGWVVLVLLALGTFGSARVVIHRLAVYQAPLQPIYELEQAPLKSYRRVQGLAFKDIGYQFYRDLPRFAGSHREVLENYYLLLDADSQWGVLVGTHERLFETEEGDPAEPVPAIVVGQLAEMPADLREEVATDEWSASDVVLVSRILESEEPRLPLGDMLALFLLVVGIGILLFTRWFNYVLFWPSPAGEVDYPGRLAVDPLETVFQLSASLPLAGSRRRVQLVEWAGRIKPAEEGWKIVAAGDERKQALGIPMPAGSVETMIHGTVYFGRSPRCALEVFYRDDGGILRRLSLSFDHPSQRWAVYRLLASDQWAAPSEA